MSEQWRRNYIKLEREFEKRGKRIEELEAEVAYNAPFIKATDADNRRLQSRIEAGLNLADEWDKQIAGCDDPYYEGLPNKWQADQLREALEARDE